MEDDRDDADGNAPMPVQTSTEDTTTGMTAISIDSNEDDEEEEEQLVVVMSRPAAGAGAASEGEISSANPPSSEKHPATSPRGTKRSASEIVDLSETEEADAGPAEPIARHVYAVTTDDEEDQRVAPQHATISEIPERLGAHVLYGIYRTRVISLGTFTAPKPILYQLVGSALARDSSNPEDRNAIYVTVGGKTVVGRLENGACLVMGRLLDDMLVMRLIQIHSSLFITNRVTPTTKTIQILVVIYGPEAQADILKSILQTHGVTLETVHDVFDADDSSDEEDAAHAKVEDADEVMFLGNAGRAGANAAMASTSGAGQVYPTVVGASRAIGRPTLSTEFRNYYRQTQNTSQEVMRQQIDELFATFRSFETLPEMDPSPRLKSILYRHQKMALTFLLQRESEFNANDPNSVVSSFWKVTKQGNETLYQNVLTGVVSDQPSKEAKGGILADDMGLGKTITTIALICTATHPPNTLFHFPYGSTGTLIICPPSVVAVWQDQITTHIHASRPLKVFLYHGNNRANTNFAALKNYDIVITTYSTLGNEYKKALQTPGFFEGAPMQSANNSSILHRIHWFRVVLDEAHGIKESTTLQAKAVHALTADRRWCITGTPLQNKLDDLYSLIRFLRIEPFAGRDWWNKYILKPVDDQGMKRLQALMKCITIRRTKNQMLDGKPIVNLPPRKDEVWYVHLEEEERDVYEAVFERGSVIFKKFDKRGTVLQHYAQILEIILRLRQICAHAAICPTEFLRDLVKPPPQADASNEEPLLTNTEENVRKLYTLFKDSGLDYCMACEAEFTAAADDSDDTITPAITACRHLICSNCAAKSPQVCLGCQRPLQPNEIYRVIQVGEDVLDDSSSPSSGRSTPDLLLRPSSASLLGDDSPVKPFPATRMSSKFKALINDLKKHRENDTLQFTVTTTAAGVTKSVIFSQWTSVLGLLEPHLKAANIKFARLDGSMTVQKRKDQMKLFRESPQVLVFLVSLKAGGVGLDLSCACRVYLLDPWWNPSVEQQAVDRIHRLGQRRPVTVIRMVIRGSIEENIIALQEKKASLAKDALMDRDDSSAKKKRKKSRSAQRDVERKRRLADLRSLFRTGSRLPTEPVPIMQDESEEEESEGEPEAQQEFGQGQAPISNQ